MLPLDYNTDDLINDVKKYRVKKEKARQLLILCRDLLSELIDC